MADSAASYPQPPGEHALTPLVLMFTPRTSSRPARYLDCCGSQELAAAVLYETGARFFVCRDHLPERYEVASSSRDRFGVAVGVRQ